MTKYWKNYLAPSGHAGSNPFDTLSSGCVNIIQNGDLLDKQVLKEITSWCSERRYDFCSNDSDLVADKLLMTYRSKWIDLNRPLYVVFHKNRLINWFNNTGTSWESIKYS